MTDLACQPADRKTELRYCLGMLAIVGLLYALCQNGQWAPGGSDDAFYLVAGRQLAQDGEYIGAGPPLWPIILAGLMKLSTSFWLLNLSLLVACLCALAMWYFILRRFVSPRFSAGICVLTGVLFEWHRFSYTLYSEAVFFSLLAGAVLLSIQINEGRRLWWRVGMLLIVCITMVAIRYASMICLPVLLGALLRGQIRPTLRTAACAIAVVGVTIGSFAIINHVTRIEVEQAIAIKSPPPGSMMRMESDRDQDAATAAMTSSKGRLGKHLGSAGDWIACLFAPPAVMGRAQDANGGPKYLAVVVAAKAFGFWVLAMLAVAAVAGARAMNWLLAAVLIYIIAFAVIWEPPVPRYLAPVAPLMLLGLAIGTKITCEFIFRSREHAARTCTAIVVAAVLGGILLCNGAILAANIYVLRSDNFCALWDAGEYQELLQMQQYLQKNHLKDNELAISVKYKDVIRKTGNSLLLVRPMSLLTDRDTISLPRNAVLDEAMLQSLRARHVRFVLTRPDETVSRLWHFRLKSAGDGVSYYLLYELTPEGLVLVKLSQVTRGLERVPSVGEDQS